MDNLTMDGDPEIQQFKQALIESDLSFGIVADIVQTSDVKNTQTILDTVCNDFESIDVLNPNEDKQNLIDIEVLPNKQPEINVGNTKISAQLLEQSAVQAQLPESNLSTANIYIKESAVTVESVEETVKTSVVPSKEYTTLQNVSTDETVIISSSLAELADAEIVQTSEDSVSIVITNPRMIKLLGGSQSLSEDACVVSETDFTPENITVSDPFTLTEGALSADNVNLTEIHSETVYQDHSKKFQSKSSSKKPASPVTASHYKTKKTPYKPIYSRDAAANKARRITVKMKNELQAKLLANSCLLCPMSGCRKSFKTLANYITHYKFCTGQKDFKHCPYCASVIFSSNKAVIHHMTVEHPEKLEEYKKNHPDVEVETKDYEEEEFSRNNGRYIPSHLRHAKKNMSKFSSKRITIGNAHMKSEFDNLKGNKKCVRFDDIVSKIHSACDETEIEQNGESFPFNANASTFGKCKTEMKDSKTPRCTRKRYFVENIIEKENYFDDVIPYNEDDEIEEEEACLPTDDKKDSSINTKSRFVLNVYKHYERYNESLKLTRDWSTQRKTYSKSTEPKKSASDVQNSTGLNCTIIQSDEASCSQDIHQLSDEYVKTRGKTSGYDSPITCIDPSPNEFSFSQTNVRAIQQSTTDGSPNIFSFKRSCDMEILTKKAEELNCKSEISNFDNKRVPCYLKFASTPNQSSSSKKSEIITFGKTRPANTRNNVGSVLDFDELLENSYKKMSLSSEDCLKNEVTRSLKNEIKTIDSKKQKCVIPSVKKKFQNEEILSHFVKEASYKDKKIPRGFHIMSKSLARAKSYRKVRNNLSFYISHSQMKKMKNVSPSTEKKGNQISEKNDKKVENANFVANEDPHTYIVPIEELNSMVPVKTVLTSLVAEKSTTNQGDTEESSNASIKRPRRRPKKSEQNLNISGILEKYEIPDKNQQLENVSYSDEKSNLNVTTSLGNKQSAVVKRPRGRPRKSNQNLIVFDIRNDILETNNKNLSENVSILQENSCVNGALLSGSNQEHRRGRGRPKKEQNLSTSNAIHIKAEKDKKRKHHDFDNEHEEVNNLFQLEQGQREIKRGRGRPRKKTLNGYDNKKYISEVSPSLVTVSAPAEIEMRGIISVSETYSNNTCIQLPPKKRSTKMIKQEYEEARMKKAELDHSGTSSFAKPPKKKYYKSEVELIEENDSDDLEIIDEKKDVDFSPLPFKKKYKRRKLPSPSGKLVTYSSPFQNVPDQGLFPKYKPKFHMFEPLSKYSEPFSKETKIAFKFNNSVEDFNTLQQFESMKGKHGYIIFTGGPITSAAFVPTPRDANQYCALSTVNDSSSIVQFYSLGLGKSVEDKILPQFDFAIVHDRAVFEITFCPQGCFEYSTIGRKNNESLPRLALVAVAVNDCIEVYSIPHPDSLKLLSSDEASTNFYRMKESHATLIPLFGKPSLISKASICTSLSWKKDELCDKIAAGYSNGMVYIWILSESSNSIAAARENNEIIPFAALKAHGTSVTGINFHPLFDRFIITSGFDKVLKVFDMNDSTVPFCVKRGLVNPSAFDSDLCGIFVSMYDGLTLSTCFKDCGLEDMEDSACGMLCSLTEKSAFSDAINALAIANMDGSLFVSCVNKCDPTGSSQFQLQFNTYEIYNTQVVSLKKDLRNLTSFVSHIADIVHVVNGLVDASSSCSREKCDDSDITCIYYSDVPCKQIEKSVTTASSAGQRIEKSVIDNLNSENKVLLGTDKTSLCSKTTAKDEGTERETIPVSVLNSEIEVCDADTCLDVVKINLANDSNKTPLCNFALNKYLSSENLNSASEKVESEVEKDFFQACIISDDTMRSECSVSTPSECSMASDLHLKSSESKSTTEVKDTPSAISSNSNLLHIKKDISPTKHTIQPVPKVVTNDESVDIPLDEETLIPVQHLFNKDKNPTNLCASNSSVNKTCASGNFSGPTHFKESQANIFGSSELESDVFQLTEDSFLCKNRTSISFPSSLYSSLVKTHGLIFTDIVKTSNSSNLVHMDDKEKHNALSLERNLFSSVKTVTWNPNLGFENWLLSGSNSGIARLLCLSEMQLNPQSNF